MKEVMIMGMIIIQLIYICMRALIIIIISFIGLSIYIFEIACVRSKVKSKLNIAVRSKRVTSCS